MPMRKGRVTKKLHELTTLCDVKACVVTYSPYENPVVWPSTEVAGAGAAPLPVAGADLPMDQNQYEPIQLYIPTGLSYHIQYQHGIYDNFKHAHIPFMNGNYYNYHQTPTVGLTTTGHMPSNNNNTPTTDV
ncbi:Transcription factor MADS-box [Arabidopsis suecica]|uniref:Transcription factor MADS-box n=1 Tax=Arabidopsis suecica TaxID=45249 RepID=A0A8T2H8U5_ARASU|nr:Transcription factor MADS-box [Arabidopsis suecica]